MILKKDDNVLIISGKDRGRKGKILEVLPKKGKIVVEGKKHTKPKRQGQKGEVVQISAAFDASNAQIICAKCTKPARVGYKTNAEKKYRACRKCGEET